MSDLLDLLKLEDLNDKEHELAEAIGLDAYKALIRTYGGSDPVYIAKANSVTIPVRNRMIIKEFDGFNSRELAEKYSLTERYVREIVKGKIKEINRQPAREQISLFDQENNL